MKKVFLSLMVFISLITSNCSKSEDNPSTNGTSQETHQKQPQKQPQVQQEPPISSWEYELSPDGKTLVRWKSTTRTTLNMQEHPILSQVTTIGTWAFENCQSLKSITFPSSLTTIKNGAFSKSGLTSVAIPEGITTIESSAFFNCKNLVSASLPKSATSIGDWIFDNCDNLEEVTYAPKIVRGSMLNNLISLKKVNLLEGVTTIGTWAFENCKSLKSITFPSTLTTIKNGAFSKSGLTSIIIPEGITVIESSAFSSCKSLVSASIPKSATSIGDWIFDYCDNLEEVTYAPKIVKGSMLNNLSNLTKVTLLESVTSINEWAFENSRKLTTVIVKATIPPLLRGENVFRNTSIEHIYVPTSSINAYKTDRVWKNFASKIQAQP